MSDTPKRPILRLKVAVQPPTPDFAVKREPKPASRFKPRPPPPPAAPEPPPLPEGDRWRCKPCGGLVVITAEMTDEDVVRCGSCNARLGLVADFRADPPPAKLRARPAKQDAAK